MNLYIEIENGVTKNHPAFMDNLIQAFGFIPTHWEQFIRIERPVLGVYELMNSTDSTYEKVNGFWMDVWHKRDMTAEEKTAKQQEVIATFRSRDQAENWSAWTLDEATCTMTPPIPKPESIEGVLVFWCGADNNWKEAPNRPVDENQYKFDFFAWQWIQVVN
jgi:hypothetical protein